MLQPSLAQSACAAQALETAQRGARAPAASRALPPQSTSLSPKFKMPSVWVAAAHTLDAQRMLVQSRASMQLLVSAHA